jgi:hypothetical protein
MKYDYILLHLNYSSLEPPLNSPSNSAKSYSANYSLHSNYLFYFLKNTKIYKKLRKNRNYMYIKNLKLLLNKILKEFKKKKL